MFLNTLSRVSFFILGFLSSLSTINAQDFVASSDNEIVFYKKLILNGAFVDLPVYQKNIKLEKANLLALQQIETNKTTVDNTVFDRDWNTSVFNTYKKKESNFPIDLHFDEETFSSPIDRKMVITSRYGWRNGRPHKGIDIDLQTGDYVKSLLPGKVRYVKYHSGHGRTVVIRHNNGLETVYAHLSEFLVKENEIVTKGQIIGKGGVSGNARGSHLHLEVRYQGKCIHPEYLFEFDATTKIRTSDIVITKEWGSPRAHKSNRKSNIQVYKPYKMATSSEKKIVPSVKTIKL